MGQMQRPVICNVNPAVAEIHRAVGIVKTGVALLNTVGGNAVRTEADKVNVYDIDELPAERLHGLRRQLPLPFQYAKGSSTYHFEAQKLKPTNTLLI